MFCESNTNLNNYNNNNNNNFNPYSTNGSLNFQNGYNHKNLTRNVFQENLLYIPKVFEDDEKVKRNITEQIKSVSFTFI